MKFTVQSLFVLAALASSLLAHAGGLEPVALRCEYRVNPQGIDVVRPRFTWEFRSNQRGAKQSANEILVASSAKRLAENCGDL